MLRLARNGKLFFVCGVGIALMLGAIAHSIVAQAQKEALSISPIEVIGLGQKTWLSGSRTALRLFVKDHDTGKPLSGSVDIALAPVKLPQKRTGLFHGALNAQGTLDASFSTLSFVPGAYRLYVDVDTPLGHDGFQSDIQIKQVAKIYLTTDKPVYQPGQIIHIRALAIDEGTMHPIENVPLTFLVEDARGNRVFKEQQILSPYGIASADFQLADEVNQGSYRLTAALGDDSSVTRVVEVKPYVLPKFQITIEPDRPYYQPGQLVTCRLRARYFFGKPVANASVKIEVSTQDVTNHELATFTGQTDPVGSYTFRYRLPTTLFAQSRGGATVDFAATIKDTADQQQQANESVHVVSQPVMLDVAREMPYLVPGLPYKFYYLVSTPDYKPLPHARVTVKLNAIPPETTTNSSIPLQGNAVETRQLVTDAFGIAEYEFIPKSRQGYRATAYVETPDGQKAKFVDIFYPNPNSNAESVLLRPDKTLARTGEVLNLICFSSQPTAALYLDVLHNNQVILTETIPISKGKGALSLPLTPDMEGTLELHAYQVMPSEQIVQDVRYVLVQPASDLHVAVIADKEEYRPGADAVFRFRITDKSGRGIPAALGVGMVDESVYALSEMRPSLAQLYFLLQQELLSPRYEVHGLSPERVFLQPNSQADAARQRAAAVLFSTAENAGAPPAGRLEEVLRPAPPEPEGMRIRGGMMIPAIRLQPSGNMGGPLLDYDLVVDTYRDRLQVWIKQVLENVKADGEKIVKALQSYQQQTGKPLPSEKGFDTLVKMGLLEKEALLDPWGSPYRVEPRGESNPLNGQDYARFALTIANREGVAKLAVGLGYVFSTIPESTPTPIYNGVVWEQLEGGFGGIPGAGGAIMLQRAVGLPEAKGVMEMAAAKGTASIEPVGLQPRVRSFFPETLYWNPNLVTDNRGEATIRVPMADSITTWRMTLLANSHQGAMGSATQKVRVFQPFFVDMNLPVALTQGDRMALPVTLYNYLPTAQRVRVVLKLQPWFHLEGKNVRTLTVRPEEVKVVYFPLTAQAIGKHVLTVLAYGEKLSDAVQRALLVEPNGQKREIVSNGTLQGIVQRTFTLPAASVPGASKLLVKVYPGVFSQIVEGLEGMLQMPYGCFEQTSSTTYPDILVLSYLRQTHQVQPSIQMRADQYIQIGYQRLVTFEVPGGGFSWFGNAPANQVLTAYGLLEFADMAKVRDVDEALIHRTQNWLASKQQEDGSWVERGPGIAEGIINRQTDALRTTAYVAWALAESGYTGPALGKAMDYLKANLQETKDPYTLALMLNCLVATHKQAPETATIAQRLMGLAHTTDNMAWWEGAAITFTGATERGADLETCGLAGYALARWGGNPSFTTKALNYIAQQRDANGTWGNTQATVWCMRALLYASTQGTGGGKGTLTVSVNGEKVGALRVSEANKDLMQQLVVQQPLKPGENQLTLHWEGTGAMAYQVVQRYYLPWGPNSQVGGHREEVLSLKVDYDRSTLAQNDTARVTVSIHNNTDRTVQMPLIDLGIPPGFSVETDGLQAAVKAHTIDKFTVAARQIILYLQQLAPQQTLELHYSVRALFPVRALIPLSKAYPYYDPQQVAIVPPKPIEVK